MKEIPQELPSSVCLRVTRRCNVACAFCQAPPTGRSELSVREIGEISRFFASGGARTAKLAGGEPTVRKDLPEIIAAVAGAGLRPVVTTNGFVVSARAMDACAEHAGEFKFSIHRPSVRNDEVLRRKSFGSIERNLAEVVRREIGLSINSVVAPGGLSVMDEMAGFACERGARKISFIPVVSRGRANGKKEFSFRSEELGEVLGRVRELARVYRGRMDVRCIDIRSRDYWIVENDGSLWIERATEDADVRICGKESLMSTPRTRPVEAG
ncbi:radical SAM protein [Streptomyces sp. DH37]|uniref:radical SAM protein n=1 Tax=Streptomyces sp. DH37 TaxID=3040122 RepID=UPI002442E160|nr:radical SAM protein [Streptomyces sp. DH37]MDG9706353.1 radical SAM protein [Streptomyces sp. DH37]